MPPRAKYTRKPALTSGAPQHGRTTAETLLAATLLDTWSLSMSTL